MSIILNNVVGSNKEITLLSGETILLTLSKIYLPTNQGYRNLEIRLTKEDSSYGSGLVGLNSFKTDTGVVRSPINLVSSSLDIQLVKQISETSTIRATNCPASTQNLVSNPIYTCTDSDGGKSYFVNGEINITSTTSSLSAGVRIFVQMVLQIIIIYQFIQFEIG